jgi:hypothetical protein
MCLGDITLCITPADFKQRSVLLAAQQRGGTMGHRRILSQLRGFESVYGRRIDLCNLAKAIGFGIMRSGYERTAHFGTVPARYNSEPERLFCFDVARR